MQLRLFYYVVAVKRKNDWYGYSGYAFAKSKTSAIKLIEERYKNGVVREPFSTNIRPSEDVRIDTLCSINIEEGVFL